MGRDDSSSFPLRFPPASLLTSAPLQVLIPSVKLDYSHVQSRCGSLDRRGYSAGGGNVSPVPHLHRLSVLCRCCFLLCGVTPVVSPLWSPPAPASGITTTRWFVSREVGLFFFFLVGVFFFTERRLNVSSPIQDY